MSTNTTRVLEDGEDARPILASEVTEAMATLRDTAGELARDDVTPPVVAVMLAEALERVALCLLNVDHLALAQGADLGVMMRRMAREADAEGDEWEAAHLRSCADWLKRVGPLCGDSRLHDCRA